MTKQIYTPAEKSRLQINATSIATQRTAQPKNTSSASADPKYNFNLSKIPISSPHVVQRMNNLDSVIQAAEESGAISKNSSLPPYAYLIQEHQPPESNLCLYYAYYHYMNGKVDREKFINEAIQPYVVNFEMSKEDALEMFYGGNDPEVLGKFGLTNKVNDYQAALNGERLIVADKTHGHFYALRKYNDIWWNYDSYRQTAPSQIGDINVAMNYLTEKKQDVWA